MNWQWLVLNSNTTPVDKKAINRWVKSVFTKYMQVEHSMVYLKRVLESMSVSDQLHTYPFPDPTTVKL